MCYLISPVFVQFVKHKTYQISEKILSNKGYLINQMTMQMQHYDIYISTASYAFHFTLYAYLSSFICTPVFNYIMRTIVLVYGYFHPSTCAY